MIEHRNSDVVAGGVEPKVAAGEECPSFKSDGINVSEQDCVASPVIDSKIALPNECVRNGHLVGRDAGTAPQVGGSRPDLVAVLTDRSGRAGDALTLREVADEWRRQPGKQRLDSARDCGQTDRRENVMVLKRIRELRGGEHRAEQEDLRCARFDADAHPGTDREEDQHGKEGCLRMKEPAVQGDAA